MSIEVEIEKTKKFTREMKDLMLCLEALEIYKECVIHAHRGD